MTPRTRLLRSVLLFGALFIALHADADSLRRIVPGEAIISDATAMGSSGVEGIQTLVTDASTFPALQRRKLSRFAARVRTNRSLTHGDARRLIAYRESLNPCNEPALQRLLRTRPSLICEPNFEVTTSASSNLINDTYRNYLYALDTSSAGRVLAPEAWQLSTGSSSVVVGIIDTGVDYNHPDLAANVWVNPNEIAANGIDDDGNGYIDDVHGIDAVNSDSDPMDDQYHGTHVAGTIGAIGNNATGVAGVSWAVKMIPCKFLSSTGSGVLSGAIQCLDYLTNLKNNAGINIVATNNSWGGGGYSVSLYQAIQRSRSAGIVFVAAAGNASSNNDTTAAYPGNYDLDNVISVAAIDASGTLASFSNYGATTVDIGAPGVEILSTIPGNTYGFLSGTSMAAPHVTGAIALLRAYLPSLTMGQSVSRIIANGSALSSLSGRTITGKNLNIHGAMIAGDLTPTPTPTATNTTSPTPISTPNVEPTPTATPTASPTTRLDSRNAKLTVSARRTSRSASIKCSLARRDAARNRQRARAASLQGYAVNLLDAYGRRRARGTTNAAGNVAFSVTTQRSNPYNRCQARMSDGRLLYSGYVLVSPARRR